MTKEVAQMMTVVSRLTRNDGERESGSMTEFINCIIGQGLFLIQCFRMQNWSLVIPTVYTTGPHRPNISTNASVVPHVNPISRVSDGRRPPSAVVYTFIRPQNEHKHGQCVAH